MLRYNGVEIEDTFSDTFARMVMNHSEREGAQLPFFLC